MLTKINDSTTDANITVASLRESMAAFVREREWDQFHSPKNLAMSLAIEAAELMEHFQWLTVEASRTIADDPQKRIAIGEELADVLSYTLAIANSLGLDLSAAFYDKLAKNALKYPADVVRGKFERPRKQIEQEVTEETEES